MKEWLKKLKLNENNISMGLGIIVVIIIALLLIKYVRGVNKPTGKISEEASATEISKELPTDYVIKPGDSLWQISESVYGTGYQWTAIYQANKNVLGTNPNLIYPDVKLTLPKIDLQNYQVVPGDTLSGIGMRLCGYSTSWANLAKANSLSNPNLITPGQTLQIKCK